MSIHRRQRKSTPDVWQVTWRDPEGRQRAETFPSRREAERRESEIRELQWRGKLEQADAGREPLREAVEIWWTNHVEPNLTRATKASYATVLDLHLLPRIGNVALRDIDPALVMDLQQQLRRDGVGGSMSHRILMVLSGIMRHAVLRGRIDRNPLQPVKVPLPKRTRAIRPLAPVSIERLRREFLSHGDVLSATLLSLMAYTGVRPGEAISLRWDNIGKRTLLVENSNDDGELKDSKTGRIRTVRLLAPVVEDLAVWRIVTPPPHEAAPLFPRPARAAWTDHDYKNWHRRNYKPAAEAVGLGASRPYDLRHSFASLMIQAGYSAVELAAELGHSPTLTLDTYSHVFSEYARGERVDPEAEIQRSRTGGPL